MRDELKPALRLAQQLPADELPELLGELETVRVSALIRLSGRGAEPHEPDKLLNADDAAARLGISKDYLYRHHREYPFARRIGRRVLFSAVGLENYIGQKRHRDILTARRPSRTLSPVASANGDWRME